MQHSLRMSIKFNYFCTIRILSLIKLLPSKDKVGSRKTHVNSKSIYRSCSKPKNILGFECLQNLSASQSQCSKISSSCQKNLLLSPEDFVAKDTMQEPSQLLYVLVVDTSFSLLLYPKSLQGYHYCQKPNRMHHV